VKRGTIPCCRKQKLGLFGGITTMSRIFDIFVFGLAVVAIMLNLAFDWPLRTLMGAENWARHKWGYRLLTVAILGVVICWVSVLTLGKANIVGYVSLDVALIAVFGAITAVIIRALDGTPPASMTKEGGPR